MPQLGKHGHAAMVVWRPIEGRAISVPVWESGLPDSLER